MLADKFIIQELPLIGDNTAERRFFSDKGEMAQILNRKDESFKHLVYWDLDKFNTTKHERGHHYHEMKLERFYIISGELELLLEDLTTKERMSIIIKAGCRLLIKPQVAHAFRAVTYSQVLEYSPDQYDPADTHPYRLEP